MSEAQGDPVVSEMPHAGGNNGQGPASSTPISPFCNLKWLIWFAQANETSFLLTNSISISMEGLFHFNGGSFSLQLLKIPKCQQRPPHTPRAPGCHGGGVMGAVLRTTYSYSPALSLDYSPKLLLAQTPPSPELQRYRHSHTEPFGAVKTRCPLCLMSWFYCWPLGEFTISFFIKAHGPY